MTLTHLLVLAIMLTGCAQHVPDLVKAGRNDYNKVLVQTDAEEQLLNLVRLRYADNPMMLDVSSVSTSFTWSQTASAEAFKFEPSSSDTNAGVRGNLAYLERPTVTYTPLGGKDFVQNQLTPMELGGWKSYEMVLRYAHLALEHLAGAAARIEKPLGTVTHHATISLR